jgi:hypothetical protein
MNTDSTLQPRLAYSIAEACRIGCQSRTSVYAAIGRGELRARKRGRRTLILAHELERYLNGLPAVPARASV